MPCEHGRGWDIAELEEFSCSDLLLDLDGKIDHAFVGSEQDLVLGAACYGASRVPAFDEVDPAIDTLSVPRHLDRRSFSDAAPNAARQTLDPIGRVVDVQRGGSGGLKRAGNRSDAS